MRTCIDCKKEIKNYKAKRCWECYVKRSQAPEVNPNWKDGVLLKKYYCTDCGKEISISSGRYRTKKCHSCGIKGEKNHFFNIHLFGVLSPTYIDGRSYKPYSIEFNKERRFKIRTRDNFTCQNCDMSEEEHLIVHGQVLHVHHIDYNKENCKEDNLISLCISCNVKANKNRSYWKDFYQNKIRGREFCSLPK